MRTTDDKRRVTLMTLVTADDKILIFEGPDGAGKTALIRFLEKTHGYKVLAFDKPKTQEEKDRMFKMYVELMVSGGILNSDQKWILDRSWYSEMVYGPIMRDKSYISAQQCYALEALLVAIGGKVIYVTADTETLVKRAFNRGEDYVNEEQLALINEEYNKLFCHQKRGAGVIYYHNR